MARYTVDLPLETALFYEKVAQQANQKIERVLADSLFIMASELSQEITHLKKEKDG